MIDPQLLAILRCPLTLQPLRPATAGELARLPEPLAAALVREDGLAAYPVRDGIPLLLPDEAISLNPPAP
jgi:uncharacterized protein YbaR (Trm112 family)